MRRGVRRAADERGAATAELVIATPALLLVLLFVIEVGLWFHASHVASAAAQEGARAGRNQGGTEQAAEAAANDLLQRLGARLVHDPHVDVVIDPRTHQVVATVEGTGPEVIPGLRLPIHARSTGPIEEFRSPAEAP